MNVIDVRGYDSQIVIGAEQGAMRIALWSVTEHTGLTIAPHHHHGEELFLVLYGKLRFTVGDSTADVDAGKVVIVPPRTTHSHTVLDGAEIEIYGEIGAGIFVWVELADGSRREEEIFVEGVPWSGRPGRRQHYMTEEEQDRLYQTDQVVK